MDNLEWMEGYLFDNGFTEDNRMFVGGLVIEEYQGTADDEWDITGIDFCEVDSSTICQYTGLIDKNGKKIWENDIVKTNNGRLCKIIWFSSRQHQGWDLTPIETINPPPLKWNLWDELEVIGNIFDNPELLS